ncbi:MAG: hypothetical protein Q4615_13700, partial [Paracoccus aminovorans]|nr:hypothetical protein [Paracoccus aminovorans]
TGTLAGFARGSNRQGKGRQICLDRHEFHIMERAAAPPRPDNPIFPAAMMFFHAIPRRSLRTPSVRENGRPTPG